MSESSAVSGLTETTCTVNKPAGVVDGDLLVAHDIYGGTAMTPPAGWTQFASTSSTLAWWHIASSEPASYTFGNKAANNYSSITIVRINGHHPTNPIGSAQVAPSVTNATTMTLPSSTVSTAGSGLLQMLYSSGSSNSSFTPPAGTTEFYDRIVSGSVTIAGAMETVHIGATGTRTWTAAVAGNILGLIVVINSIPPATGAVSIQSESSAWATSLDLSCVVNKPAGVVDGDLLVAHNVWDGNVMTPPAGWTQFATATYTRAWWRIASAEPASYTFGNKAPNSTASVTILRITGHHPATPISSGQIAPLASGANITLPTSTATAAGSGLLQMIFLSGVSSLTPPVNTSEFYDKIIGGSATIAGGCETIPTGSTGTRTWTPPATSSMLGLIVIIEPLPLEPNIVSIQSESADISTSLDGALIIPKPAGTANGDLLIAHIANESGSVTAPAGWTAMGVAGATQAFWKIASAESASITFTKTIIAANVIGTLVRITGHDPVSPIAVAANLQPINSSSVVLPSVTSARINTGLIQMTTNYAGGGLLPPAGTTEVYDHLTASGNSIAGGYQTVPAGATGTRTWNCNTSGTVYGTIVAVNLEPAAVGSVSGNIRVLYRTTNTFTVPVGVTSIFVECGAGGGAGGGGNTVAAGGAGGGGAYAASTLTVTPGATHAVTVAGIRAGGAAGTAGATGFVSSFGAGLVSAAAGLGGGGPSGAGGVTPGVAGAGGSTANSTGTTKTAGVSGSGTTGGAGAPPLGGTGVGRGTGGTGGAGVSSTPGGAGQAGSIRITFNYATDVVSIDDHIQFIVNFKRAQNETVVVNDSILKAILKPYAETAAATDTLKKFVAKGQAETLTAADSFLKSYNLLKSESVLTADTIKKIVTFFETNGVSTADAFKQVVGKSYPENITTADQLRRIINKPVAEGVTVSDSTLVILIYLRQFFDAASAVDIISKRLRIGKAETVSAISAVTKVETLRFNNDQVLINDSVVVTSIYKRLISESSVVVDYASKRLSVNFVDSISGASSAGRSKRKIFIISD
jgi:hypothetical protein